LASSDAAVPGAITLDELIALNDEIAALTRAGVPLEPALCRLGDDLPGRLGKIATAVAQRGSRGESLDQVLADGSLQLPPVYRAVVEAGARTGRLPAALEAMAGSIRRVSQTQHTAALAALYPLLVLMVGWALFAFFTSRIAPVLLDGLDRIEMPSRTLFGWMTTWGQSADYWGPIGLGVFALLAGAWWYLSTRVGVLESGRTGRLLGWMPWIGRTLHWSRTATFVDVLALLVESSVPLEEAVPLAAGASGSRKLKAGAENAADALRRGETFTAPDALDDLAGLPPLLRWMMAVGRRRGALLPALRTLRKRDATGRRALASLVLSL